MSVPVDVNYVQTLLNVLREKVVALSDENMQLITQVRVLEKTIEELTSDKQPAGETES